MAVCRPALIMTLWLSFQHLHGADSNFNYNFAECAKLVYHKTRVEGAEVRSQHAEFYEPDTSNCSLILTTIVTHVFLVQLTHLDLAVGQTGCHDYLTIVDLDVINGTRELLNGSCSSGPQYWYTTGQHVLFNFIRRGNTSSSHRGFRISVAALTRPPEPCEDARRFKCGGNNDCISHSLTCDGVQHCLRADDENPDLCPSPLSPVPTTPRVLTATEPAIDDEGNFYLWLPLIVVVVFTLVMLMLIMAGRRVTACNNGYSNPQTQDGLEINSNPGFTDGAPATPPPTYSMIERQTSYVSQISQTSSQLSIPPDYDEVVEDGGMENGGNGRRRRRLTSRSNSDSSRRSWFHRSNSAPGRRARFASESSGQPQSNRQRPRYFSDVGGSADVNQDQISESDSVFLDPPPQPHAMAAGPSTPSGLEGVLEADETGSSGNVTSSSSDRPSTVSSASTSLLLTHQAPSHGHATAPQLATPSSPPHPQVEPPQAEATVTFSLGS